MLTISAMRSRLRSFANDSRGITAVYTAVVMVVLAGVAGLGVDAASWEMARQKLQGVADQSAYSAVIGVSDGLSGYTNAEAMAAQLGYGCATVPVTTGGSATCATANGATLYVNHPAQSGKYLGVSDSWEFKISQPQQLWFSRLFLASAPVIQTRAVGLQQGTNGNVCMLALDTNTSDIHSIFGNQTGTVTVGGSCQVADNLLESNATDDVDVKSGAVLNFVTLSMRDATKCDSGNCQGTLNVTNPIVYNQAAVLDPYATRTVPVPADCSAGTNVVISTSQTLQPGNYCGTNGNAAISISGAAASLTLQPPPPPPSGTTTLTFTSTTGVSVGMGVTDSTTSGAIPSGTTVTAKTATTVTLSHSTLGGPSGPKPNDIIVFTNAGGVTVTLATGTYILNGKGGGSCTNGTTKASACSSGNFSVTNGATVTGTGVTIVLTTTTAYGSNVGNMNIDDSSALSIAAPTSNTGGYQNAGIAIWQSSLAPNPGNPGPGFAETDPGVNTVGSGSTTNITGLVYFPSQAVLYSGGAGSDACTQVVAWAIQFLKGANFSYPSNCPATAGVMPIGGSPTLAE
jgi:hypothetical protein